MRKSKLYSLGINLLISVLISISAFSQQNNPVVNPPNWWVGMKNDTLQILMYQKNIAHLTSEINYSGITILSEETQQNLNYKFLNLLISPETKPCKFTIILKENNKIKYKIPYELKNRKPNSADRIGFGNKDVIYLLMPDRFANGKPANDSISGMPDKMDRTNKDARHGGDIQGIINNLDYFDKLGVTAIWINPLLENNMKSYSYHGYAATDLYKIDARFGSNEDYKNLADSLHAHGLKLIMDMVFNHVGSENFLIKDLPNPDWIHQFPEYTQSNYRAETLMDPHASKVDKDGMSDGWFDRSMPDLNQKNPYLAKYLIQNSIWWIEFAGLDGIRMDTWPYNDQDFMNRWLEKIYNEYPDFKVVGETWLQNESSTAWFQKTNNYPKVNFYNTDFPLMYAINQAFNENDGWTNGLARFYYVLSQDNLYVNTNNLLIFADNHDVTRIFTSQNQDIQRWKLAMTLVLTMRGIPEIYYGTEYLETGLKEDGDGFLRKDVPGGWKGDSVNVFKQKNMSKNQLEAFDFLSNLIKLRKEHPCMQSGKLTQYFPIDGTYAYFRFNDSENYMVIFNNNNSNKTIDLKRFKESFGGMVTGTNLSTGQKINLNESLEIATKTAVIIKIK